MLVKGRLFGYVELRRSGRNMNRRTWYVLIGATLVLTSVILYLIHFGIFGDAHHIYIYMVGDLAFLPIEVLVVTLIVDTMLSEREKRQTLKKLNMVFGAFYSEVGTELLRRLCAADRRGKEKLQQLESHGEWKKMDFRAVRSVFASDEFKVDSSLVDLESMRDLLLSNRDFMVRLLENPLLLEHATFTDLLWAVFHLTEELASRKSLEGLPEPDMDHLGGDMSRAYGTLALQWLEYMAHLRDNYPYLFSLAMRLNPFEPETMVEFA
jgi:hypothetical protein